MNNVRNFLCVIVFFLLVIEQSSASNVDGSSVIGVNNMLEIKGAYQPFRPSVMPMKAGYLTVKNISDNTLRINKVFSPDYESVSLHQSVQEDGMSSMEMIDHVEIAPGQEVNFEPGGLHLMLYQSLRPQQQGDVVTIIFQLDDGVKVPFEMQVTKS